MSFADKPHNPMLNSGAIMCSAIASNLVEPKMKNSEKFDYILNYMRVSWLTQGIIINTEYAIPTKMHSTIITYIYH